MTVRSYLPTTLPALGRDWELEGPDATGGVVAAEESEEAEYAALMEAAEASAALVQGLPDGARRRVVVVAETATPDGAPTWRDIVAVHVDSTDDADPDADLGWWATQEIGDLIVPR